MARKKKNVPGQGVSTKLQFIGNVPTDATFDILYQRYVKAYDAAKGKLRAGERMYLLKRNKQEFKDFYLAVSNIEPESSTPAAKANNIISRMVEESRYEFSNIQARAYKKGLSNLGIDASVVDIRSGRYDSTISNELEAAIRERGRELKSEGKSSYEVRRIIGIEFFDSPT